MKFCGKYKGCVRETLVSEKGIYETEYKAVIIIKNVNCSHRTAYMITGTDSEGDFSYLAFKEDLNKPVLRAVSEHGITSTYFDGSNLIHQISAIVPDCKHKSKKVKFYKMTKC